MSLNYLLSVIGICSRFMFQLNIFFHVYWIMSVNCSDLVQAAYHTLAYITNRKVFTLTNQIADPHLLLSSQASLMHTEWPHNEITGGHSGTLAGHKRQPRLLLMEKSDLCRCLQPMVIV